MMLRETHGENDCDRENQTEKSAGNQLNVCTEKGYQTPREKEKGKGQNRIAHVLKSRKLWSIFLLYSSTYWNE